MSALYLPFFQGVLKTKPLTASELLVVLCAASTPLWVMELVKLKRRLGAPTMPPSLQTESAAV